MNDVLKVLLAAALLFLGMGGAALIPGINDAKPAVTPAIDAPPAAHQAAVANVKTALAGYSANEKALWRELWTQAGAVVAADTAAPADFPTTTALRELVVELLTDGWVVLGGHAKGENPKLDAAVNAAITELVGDKEIGATPEIRSNFQSACRALAWAGQ